MKLTENQLDGIKHMVENCEKGTKVFKTSIGFFSQCSGTPQEKLNMFEGFLGTPVDRTAQDPMQDYLNERLLDLHINTCNNFFQHFGLKNKTVSMWFDQAQLNRTRFTTTDIQQNFEKLCKFSFDTATDTLYGLLFPSESKLQSMLFKILDKLSSGKTNGFEYDNLHFNTAITDEQTSDNVQRLLDLAHCLKVFMQKHDVEFPILAHILKNPKLIGQINHDLGFALVESDNGEYDLDSIAVKIPSEVSEKLNIFLARCDLV